MCANPYLNLMHSANKQAWISYSDFMPWPKQTVGYVVHPGVGKLLLFFCVFVSLGESLVGIKEV